MHGIQNGISTQADPAVFLIVAWNVCIIQRRTGPGNPYLSSEPTVYAIPSTSRSPDPPTVGV